MLQRALLSLALFLPALALAQANAPAAKNAAPPAAKAATKEAPAKPDAAPRVLLKTNLGDITIELYPDKAPKSVENFLGYVQSGFYDDTIFHRVIANFMIQGGGFTSDLRQKHTRPAIPIESKNGLSNLRGTVAMARTMDPNSATAQFFINTVDNQRLDYASDANPGYAVFGKVVSGMDVVDKIRTLPTGPQGPFQSDVPTNPAVIEKASVLP